MQTWRVTAKRGPRRKNRAMKEKIPDPDKFQGVHREIRVTLQQEAAVGASTAMAESTKKKVEKAFWESGKV